MHDSAVNQAAAPYRDLCTDCGVSRSSDPKRKLPGSWEISETPQGRLACINTARANALVEEALRAGLIVELAGFTAL